MSLARSTTHERKITFLMTKSDLSMNEMPIHDHRQEWCDMG
jgi:hypothetical protein